MGSFPQGPLGDSIEYLLEFCDPKGENLSASLHLSSAEGCSWAHTDPQEGACPVLTRHDPEARGSMWSGSQGHSQRLTGERGGLRGWK